MPAPARLGLLSLLLLVCAACGSSAETTPPVTASAATPRTSPAVTQPAATETRAAATATAAPVATSPGTVAGAEACTASADQKGYFVFIAQQVKWPVYCAVLPEGWYLLQSQYSLDSGGQITVSYESSGKAHHLELQEGAYCTAGDSSCQLKGQAVGPTLYGDLTGTLYTLLPGYAVYVNAGTNPPSWAAASVDLDETTFVKLVAGLHKVTP